MSGLLEEYGRLFKRHLSDGCRIDPFFLDSALLPGPKSEIRRQLLGRLRQQPVEARPVGAPILWFLAHFIDEYREIEQQIPGFFDQLNSSMRNGGRDLLALGDLLDTLGGQDGNPVDQRAREFALKLQEVAEAYWTARDGLDRDLEALGVRRTP